MHRSESQRKKPLQLRSKAMVDSILDAAARVFAANGFERATTNAIAEVAGVSIGSVYQYFPDKRALLEALHERHVIGLWHRAAEACVQACSLPWPAALRHFVATTLDYNRNAGALFGLFQKELPAVFPGGAQVDRAKLIYQDALRKFLQAHEARLKVEVEKAVYMIPIIGKGVVTTVFHSRPEDLKNGRLVDELTTVYENYLCSSNDYERLSDSTRDREGAP